MSDVMVSSRSTARLMHAFGALCAVACSLDNSTCRLTDQLLGACDDGAWAPCGRARSAAPGNPRRPPMDPTLTDTIDMHGDPLAFRSAAGTRADRRCSAAGRDVDQGRSAADGRAPEGGGGHRRRGRQRLAADLRRRQASARAPTSRRSRSASSTPACRATSTAGCARSPPSAASRSTPSRSAW